MIKKLKQKLKTLIIAFSHGFKNTESEMLGQKTTLSETNSIEQKMQQNDLAEALLKGEVTEQVEILRDRTYLISDESKKYKVIIDTVGTSKAIKKMAKKTPPKCFNYDGFDIQLVMDNTPIPTSVLQAMESIGGYGIKDNYPLKFEYEYTPKFKLDEYTTKLVIRRSNDGENTLLDLYIPKFTDSFERLVKIFDNELNKIKNGQKKPINIMFETVHFVADKAFGSDDLTPHTFKVNKFIDINEFDGKNVLTYDVTSIGDNTKITEKYKNKKLRNAYSNNERRGTKLDLGNTQKENPKCENCGCEMDSHYDFRITKQTTGRGLCKNCLGEVHK